MTELPQGWVAGQLLDIVDLHDSRRIPLNAKQRATKKGNFPYYGANGLVDRIDDYIFDGEYVLLAEDGGYFDDPSRGVAYEVSGKFWVNNHAHILSTRGGIPRRFITYTLNSLRWLQYVSGTTRLKLTQQGMQRVNIPLPPLSEQHRIVAKLDSLFQRTRRAREELSHIPRLIENYKKAILDAAFRGDLTKDWREQKGLPNPEEIVFGDVAEGFSYGSSAKSSPTGKVPVLRMGNIQNMALDWSDLVYTSNDQEIAKYNLVAGDVLFNRTNSPELVGKTAIYKGEQPAIYAGYLIRIRCGNQMLPQYLNYCLNSPMGRTYCWRVKTDGVSQSNINAKKLAAFSFLLPDPEEQEEIVRRIEKALDWLNTVYAEQGKAAHLIDHLDQANLAKAFRGELVPQDPNDEPASVLLERIRADRAAQPRARRGRLRKTATRQEAMA
jgi:type I restriction enzyme S subunit